MTAPGSGRDSASAGRWVTEVIPSSLERVDTADDTAAEWMSRRYRSPHAAFVRLNMVTTLTGSSAGEDGSSTSISSRVDRMILGAIRREADVVVVGAETVRAEGSVLPKTARLAIVTASGALGGGSLRRRDGREAPPALLLCRPEHATRVAAAIGDAPAEVVAVPSSDSPGEDAARLHPADIVRALRERGLSRIVCEGGAGLATQFVQSGVVDEVCVTVSPFLEPVHHPFLSLATPVASEVTGMLVDDAGFSYRRLTIRR
ncbi:5-amino-6-(5-phosphoribosylamino)uracil reductase [Microbacterium sp. AK009]|uniref:RibD family protein n=1 Tax=Microbacterium sp. AK009 TaxID=2723068 RepID=UPI0015CDC822|nr:dihydrofolate reductase family protein [Microbacterium sp. AK009]NYF16158.1 5-amino-6-(5-phosphoribosylamino)uracil reductase [Microbacterium sp. AK009]